MIVAPRAFSPEALLLLLYYYYYGYFTTTTTSTTLPLLLVKAGSRDTFYHAPPCCLLLAALYSSSSLIGKKHDIRCVGPPVSLLVVKRRCSAAESVWEVVLKISVLCAPEILKRYHAGAGAKFLARRHARTHRGTLRHRSLPLDEIDPR
jgi:hypothetical protein